MVNNIPVFWKRIGYIAIEDRNGKMIKFGGSYDSLDFRFEGEKVGDIYPRFKCGILGLSMDHIQQLTVWNQAEAVKRARKIQVFAGYEKDGIANPIFEGFILTAMPTNPPEMWLNFDCLCSLDQAIPVDKEYVAVGTIKSIFKEIATILSLGCRWDSKKVDPDKRVKFSIRGTKSGLANRFAEAFGLKVYNNNGVLTALDPREWYNDAKNAVEISTDTGMLGLGNVTMAGATIKTRLSDRAGLMSWINLKSKIVPSANGNYYVIRKKHVGHFRGDEWYTELETIRKQKI